MGRGKRLVVLSSMSLTGNWAFLKGEKQGVPLFHDRKIQEKKRLKAPLRSDLFLGRKEKISPNLKKVKYHSKRLHNNGIKPLGRLREKSLFVEEAKRGEKSRSFQTPQGNGKNVREVLPG